MSRAGDAAVGTGLVLVILAGGMLELGPPGPSGSLGWGAVTLAIVAGVTTAMRRRFPAACLAVVNADTFAWFHLDYHGRLITIAPLIGCYTLAAGRGWRAGAAGGMLTTVCTFLTVRFTLSGGWFADQVFNAVPLVAAATALGTAVHLHRAFAEGARDWAERLAEARSDQARRQAAEERLEIARELHDVFGHTMAAISVQAGVAVHVMRRRPEQAAEALNTIKRISDGGLAEVQVVLGAMRSEDLHTATGGLAKLDKLLDIPGVGVELALGGEDRTIPVAVDLAAYRIIQESLTNVRRHAHGATRVRIELTYGERLRIVVHDDGRPADVSTTVGGNGIEGMRARAEKLGGTLTAARTADEGFEVWCELPIRKDSA
ncbi:sensor histidine kinase [Streptomyces sp. NPDC005989]|uniref:sensor histidine kinase n=1 Tax=Streptomyces sp. NPDC005989 TaxID=3156727 RepID=UPI0033F7FD61